jgi:hypothetical protein
MAKLGNPFGGKSQVWLTQTYHGSSNTAIDCYWKQYEPNLSVYAIADGEILGRSSSSGSYCYQSVNGTDMRIWYVHTHNWKPKGTKVKKGDKICEIAPKSKNGGYPEHLHLGLTPKGKYYIMDYFDREIPFRTRYSDIKASWFKADGTLNWSKFADKHIPGTEPDPCEKYKTEITKLKAEVSKYKTQAAQSQSKVVECEKRITLLEGANTELRAQLGDLQRQLEAQEAEAERKYNQLKSKYNKVVREKGDCQEELSRLKNHRFNWVLEWLDKVVPKKNG